MTHVAMPPARNRAWQRQHETYGEQFAAIYDRLFPAGDGELVAQRLRRLVPDALAPDYAEYGVGTGRVAVPLARRGAVVHGVDSSTALLARAHSHASGLGVVLHPGDMREWLPPRRVRVAYCVCGTLSMQPDRAAQQQVLRQMADAVTGDGTVVIETHSPERVLQLHGDRDVVAFEVDVQGVPGGVRCRSELSPDRSRWQLDHRWSEDGEHAAREFSLLTSPEQLADLAAVVGLEVTGLESSWDGAVHDSLSPTYIAYLRKDMSAEEKE